MPKVPSQRPCLVMPGHGLAVGGPSAASLLLPCGTVVRGPAVGLSGVSQSKFGTSWLGCLRQSAHVRKPPFWEPGTRFSPGMKYAGDI